MGTQRYTVEQIERAVRESRGLLSPAARKLGCERQTVENYVKRYPRIQIVIDEARDQLVDSAEIKLIEAIEKGGEQWAIALVLKTLGKKRGYVERTEQDVMHSTPQKVEHEHKFDFGEYQRLFAAHSRADGANAPDADGAEESLDSL